MPPSSYLDGFVPGRGYAAAPSPAHDIRFHPQGWYYLSRALAAPTVRPYHGCGPGHWVQRHGGWLWLPIGHQTIAWRGRTVEVVGSPVDPLRAPWVATTDHYWVNSAQLPAAADGVLSPDELDAVVRAP